MKRNPQSPYSRSSWTAILETSRLKAGEQVFEKIKQQKKLDSILRSTYNPPSNNSTFQIEKNEITPQLSVLKTSLDVHRSRFASSENKIFNLKLENSRIEELYEEAKQKLESLEVKVESTLTSIQKVKEKQDNEVDTRKSLFHVFDRMRTTLVFLKEKKRKLWENVHLQDFSLDIHKKKSTKVKESIQVNQLALEFFQNTIENERVLKENDLKGIKSNVEVMQKVAQEREEHLNQEKMMTEQILLNDQSNSLDQIRRQYYSHFVWFMLSSQHFEKEKIKYKVYEDAYAKIKIATGISDVPTFVDKFLTQEQRFNDFMLAVKSKEEKVLEFKSNIHNMQVLIDNFNSNNQLSEDLDRKNSTQFRVTQKKLVDSLVKYKRLKMVRKKISEWIRKISSRIEGYEVPESENLQVLMKSLKKVVILSLKSIDPATYHSTFSKLKHQKNAEIIESLIRSK